MSIEYGSVPISLYKTQLDKAHKELRRASLKNIPIAQTAINNLRAECKLEGTWSTKVAVLDFFSFMRDELHILSLRVQSIFRREQEI